MKKIEIQGKRNQDRMKVLQNPETVIERKASNKWGFTEDAYTSEIQFQILTTEQTEQTEQTKQTEHDDLKHPTKQFLIGEIEKKLKSYKNQDIANKIYDERWFVTSDAVVLLIKTCALKCHYCKKPCTIIYKEAFARQQWTLDRINNNFGHNRDNVVISCLDCNLQRGDMDSERFRMGKQFRFVKKI